MNAHFFPMHCFSLLKLWKNNKKIADLLIFFIDLKKSKFSLPSVKLLSTMYEVVAKFAGCGKCLLIYRSRTSRQHASGTRWQRGPAATASLLDRQLKKNEDLKQCFGSGSGRIRIIWSDPDPDQYQETFIWIRVAPKINQNHGINKSKWFVNVLFTFYMTKIFQNYL